MPKAEGQGKEMRIVRIIIFYIPYRTLQFLKALPLSLLRWVGPVFFLFIDKETESQKSKETARASSGLVKSRLESKALTSSLWPQHPFTIPYFRNKSQWSRIPMSKKTLICICHGSSCPLCTAPSPPHPTPEPWVSREGCPGPSSQRWQRWRTG